MSYEVREKFCKHFSLSEKQYDHIWKLFLEYGMTRGEAPHRSRANHYFLQGISEHYVVEWHEWKSKMTKELKDIIKTEYPQLMVTDKTFKGSY